jgi:phosphoribosylformimino-5-aminoimidazole carboxamide ribotide isomerase
MLIPSIDLKDHAVVQLFQGERLAIKDPHVLRWIRKFEKFPKVQVIDLDAAMGTGNNLDLVQWIARSLSCRVGGGIRSVDRARLVLEAGAQQVIADRRLQGWRAGPRVRPHTRRRGRARARDRGRG